MSIQIGDIVELKKSGVLGEVTSVVLNPFTDEKEIWARWEDTNEVLWVLEEKVTLYSRGG
ncbi:TPA: hypothetical protein ACSVZR_003495 [Bacillus cereus]